MEELNAIYERMRAIFAEEAGFVPNDGCDAMVRLYALASEVQSLWGDRIFEKCGIGRDEGGDGGKTLEIRGKRRLSARDGGANYQQS